MPKPEPKEPHKDPPKGLWRRKYPCRRSKGEHAFVLVKPNDWLSESYKHLTVEEYYAQADEARERAREKGHWAGRRWREWRCLHCGKREMDSEEYPKKKVRVNLYQE